jgi:hypothetical protein
MAISRAQLVQELEPGLNALFGLEYKNYEQEHTQIYDIESSDRAFEEEVMLSGFGEAPVKTEGAGLAYDTAQEVFTARYTHETIALAFSLTEEAVEDNLYDRLARRYTMALARSMATTKQIKAASVLNGAFTTSIGGDGSPLCADDHPIIGGPNQKNELATPADRDFSGAGHHRYPVFRRRAQPEDRSSRSEADHPERASVHCRSHYEVHTACWHCRQ